ncbi:leucine rich adaptor protein 1-like [Centroberyx gerrardi]|uniref:leucine rich adaptor protein 1-like n=1 Tax=Centroberyx gerrardi TaxID=166262 RepID=UPI003AB00A8E
MDSNITSDFRDIEKKMGRKIPESLFSVSDGKLRDIKPVTSERPEKTVLSDPQSLQRKIQLLKREMAQLRDMDVKLMRHLLSINDGIESTRWALEERADVGPLAPGASRDSSPAGSLCSLAEGQDASWRSSLSSLQQCDCLDAMSLGSYLDTQVEDPTPCHPLTG